MSKIEKRGKESPMIERRDDDFEIRFKVAGNDLIGQIQTRCKEW